MILKLLNVHVCIIFFSALYVYLMKCDFSVGAYGNYFSRQAVTYLGDHNSFCCMADSTLELLQRRKDLNYQRCKK